jgi:hypothetical protein
MHCQEFETRWNDMLDRRESATEDSALQAHAAECDACAALLAGGALLDMAFPVSRHAGATATLSSSLVVSPRLADRVLAEVELVPVLPVAELVERPVQQRSSRRWLAWIAVAAACCLVAVVISKRQDQRPAAPEIAAPVAPPVVQPAHNAQQLAQQETQNDEEYDITVPTSLKREQLTWVGYQVADGIKPVTIGVSNALQSLKKPLRKSENSNETQPPRESGRSSWNRSEVELYV